MAWMDRVFLARYDETQNNVDLLTPLDSGSSSTATSCARSRRS